MKTAVYEVKDFQIILPEIVVFDENLVNKLMQREIGTIQEDVEDPNRRALDTIIFDALDLTTGERDGVYEAVTQLVTTRLQKAKSV